MTIMRVASYNGCILTYDTDDAEKVEISTPADIIDVTKPEDIYIHRELGTNHLNLHVTFKDGKCWRWVDQADVTPPDLTAFAAYITEHCQRLPDDATIPIDLGTARAIADRLEER